MRRALTGAALALVAGIGTIGLSPVVAEATTLPTGPDVSSYQHPNGACINWKTVATGQTSTNTPPRQFAFIKATEGTGYTNPYFRSCAGSAAKGDWAASATAGLARGAYHFARPALPLSSATDQAKYFASAIGDQKAKQTLPPVLDLETSGGLTPGQLVTWTQLWVDEMRTLTGRVPIIYTYPYFWSTAMANSAAFHRDALWVAEYNGGTSPSTPLPGGWPTWTTWQYSSAVPQPGISGGDVDMSRYNGTTTQLGALADGTLATTWTVTAPSAPVHVRASAGSGSATVSWIPSDNGGALVSSYRITASGGKSITVGGTTTSTTMTGLTNGTAYTFTVTATNSAGTSGSSAASNSVTPMIPTDVTSAVSPTSVVSGQSTTFTAALVRTDTGAALPGMTLAVWQRSTGGSTWTHVGDATTDSSGVARWTFKPKVSTDTRMVWTPPTGYEPQTTYVRTVTVGPVPTALTATLHHSVVAYGKWNAVTATLTGTDTHTALSGRTIAVFTRPHGTSTWKSATTLTTDSNGQVTWWFKKFVNTDVELSWTAPANWSSATATRVARVAPIVMATLSSTTTTVNHSVWLRGSVTPNLAGVTVYRQGYYSGAWHTWATTTLSSTSTYAFKITPTVKTTDYYRVRIAASTRYAASVSPTVTLIVN